MQTRATLKSVTTPASGDATASVQIRATGNLEALHDSYPISHAIDRGLLTPGADVVVDIPDLNHPGDGQVIAIAEINEKSQGAGGAITEQNGNTPVTTDGAGTGTATVSFAPAFSTAPTVRVAAPSSQLGAGTLAAAAVSNLGFTINITTSATISGSITVSWSATGT